MSRLCFISVGVLGGPDSIHRAEVHHTERWVCARHRALPAKPHQRQC